eukprot:CAMPEP_0172013104 /NCGR_PEP_ID=MMETSP1041-20130122/9199_1 /TAXON_ID=464988 /ORGANISM="Hemiselmis andersenii, Strain CCMP439" /LENGTH=553 /DNA_ID=CAMNT_0012667737 /DNA_START=210 /DNA_END=1869 /DNA_ORIENTATION=-
MAEASLSFAAQPKTKKINRSLDTFDEYNIAAPLLTSPRSIEACKRQGIEAEELVFRYEDSFFEKGITQDIQEIRWKHYEKKRRDKLSLVREERLELISMGWEPSVGKSMTASGNDTGNDTGLEAERRGTAALKEQRQMESIKAKRQQELEQMVAYELKLTQVAEEQQRQIEADRHKEAQRQKEAQARQKAWEEIQRQKEVDKVKEEARQERIRKKLAVEEYQKEQDRKLQEELEEKARLKAARQREVDARLMREEHKKQTEMIIEQQQKVVEKRRQEMQEKDERRKAEMEARQLESMVKAEEERQRAQQRIQSAMEQQREMLKMQRRLYHERQDRNAVKRAQYEAAQRAETERLRQVAEMKKDELTRAFKKMERIENKKRRQTLEKEQMAEKNLQAVRQQREIDHRQKMERQKLKQADKLEAVERLNRIQLYKREQAVDRLNADDDRTNALAAFKEKMLEERKAFRRQNEMERHKVIESMEKLRQQPSKALKTLKSGGGMDASTAATERSPRPRGYAEQAADLAVTCPLGALVTCHSVHSSHVIQCTRHMSFS